MTKTSRHFLCAAALVLLVTLGGQATDPAAPQQGKVLILTNERVLQGDIERVGKHYRIRRSIGETLLPAEQARHLCATLEDAYAYLLAQANLNDADERLRLARWCHLHGLRQPALEEATAAVKLRPTHADSQRLLRGLQRAATQDSPPPAAPTREDLESAALPSVPCNAAALGLFVNRVEPILMNTCAKCHAAGKGGAFKLVRGFEQGGLTNRRTSQQNLAAALALLNRDRPGESPLLTYAVTLHGATDQPPLKNRQTTAFRTLEEWAQFALTDVPRSAAVPKPAAPAVQAPVLHGVPVTASREQPLPVQEPPAAEEKAEPATPFARPAPPEKTEPTGADPFDPAIFNKQMHPQTGGR